MLPRGQATASQARPQRPLRAPVIRTPQLGPKIVAGDGPPSADQGNPHDLYIDTTSNNFYGPKDPSTGWGTPLP